MHVDHTDDGQLLVRVSRRQRLVRVRADRGKPGVAGTACNNNASLPKDPPTGQMYGGYYVDQGPAGYHNSALYSDPRIAIYVGMGMHQMPGDVWWRSWRTPPPRLCPTDPDDSTQGQFPDPGEWQ